MIGDFTGFELFNPFMNTPPKRLSTPPGNLSTPPVQGLYSPATPDLLPSSQPFSTPPQEGQEAEKPQLWQTIPESIKERIKKLPIRSKEPELLSNLIVDLCEWRSLSSKEISVLLDRDEKYLFRKFLALLRAKQEMEYTKPEMPNHPDQAY